MATDEESFAGGVADYSAAGAKSSPRQHSKLAGPTSLTSQAQIKTAAIGLRTKSVDRVLQQIADVALVSRGQITSEDTATNRRGEAVRSRVVMRVPVDQFEPTLTKVKGLGVLHSLARSVEDVTAQVADIDSRVRSAQDSIASLRRLFSAAQKLGDIIALENELSQREADLEALQAQQRALADQTALSTITITVTKATTAPKPGDSDKAGGFIAGLKAGWDALVGFVQAVSHGLGLLLPLGTLLLLTAGLIWFLVRRLTPWMRPRESE